MATTPDTSGAKPSALESELAGIFEALQEQRGALVDAARLAQLNARLLVLREVRRLKAERGPLDARVTRYENSSRAILQRVAALEVEAQIARIRVPPVARTGTLLQGRVTDEASRGLARLTVALIDEDGKPVANVPPVETDDSGYYAFVLQAAQVEAIGPDRKLTLQVGSSGAKLLVPAAAAPLTLTPGKAIVAEMRLLASELDALHLRPASSAAEAAAKPPAEAAKTTGKPGKKS
jgi:hypothetical protein